MRNKVKLNDKSLTYIATPKQFRTMKLQESINERWELITNTCNSYMNFHDIDYQKALSLTLKRNLCTDKRGSEYYRTLIEHTKKIEM